MAGRAGKLAAEKLGKLEAEIGACDASIERAEQRLKVLSSNEAVVADRMEPLTNLLIWLDNETNAATIREIRERLQTAVAAVVTQIKLFSAGDWHDGDKEDPYWNATFRTGYEHDGEAVDRLDPISRILFDQAVAGDLAAH